MRHQVTTGGFDRRLRGGEALNFRGARRTVVSLASAGNCPRPIVLRIKIAGREQTKDCSEENRSGRRNQAAGRGLLSESMWFPVPPLTVSTSCRGAWPSRYHHCLQLELGDAFRDRFIEQLLHLLRSLFGKFALLASKLALLFAKLSLFFS